MVQGSARPSPPTPGELKAQITRAFLLLRLEFLVRRAVWEAQHNAKLDLLAVVLVGTPAAKLLAQQTLYIDEARKTLEHFYGKLLPPWEVFQALDQSLTEAGRRRAVERLVEGGHGFGRPLHQGLWDSLRNEMRVGVSEHRSSREHLLDVGGVHVFDAVGSPRPSEITRKARVDALYLAILSARSLELERWLWPQLKRTLRQIQADDFLDALCGDWREMRRRKDAIRHAHKTGRVVPSWVYPAAAATDSQLGQGNDGDCSIDESELYGGDENSRGQRHSPPAGEVATGRLIAWDFLRRLDPRDMAIFRLMNAGFTASEIDGRLGMSEGYARKRIQRARKRLGEDGFGSMVKAA